MLNFKFPFLPFHDSPEEMEVDRPLKPAAGPEAEAKAEI